MYICKEGASVLTCNTSIVTRVVLVGILSCGRLLGLTGLRLVLEWIREKRFVDFVVKEK